MAAPIRLYNAVSDEVAKERRLRLQDASGWASLFGFQSHSGKTVNLDSAMQLSAVWACIKVTAQAVSSLPIHIYEKQPDGGRERVEDDDLAQVLSESPNQDQTSLEFWEEQVAWLLAQGNAYAEKVYNGRGQLIALQPLAASHCKPVRRTDGTLVYRIADEFRNEDLPRDKVFHIKGFGQGIKDRDLGLSPIAYGVHSMGSALAAEETAGKMFGNGLMTSGVLTVKDQKKLTSDQRGQLQEIMEKYAGSEKAGKMMVLPASMDYARTQLNPEDAQMLETRRFSIEDICRWFGTPPIVIGHSADGQTMWGTGVEQILLSWLTLGIDPICDRIEARIKKQIIRPTGRRRRYAEFNREALLQMDSGAKAEFLSTMVQNGLMDRNEARQKLNLGKRDGAGDLTAQTNLAPLDSLSEAQGGDANTARQALRQFLQIDDSGDQGSRQ
jgi:HK97 family phage portal protein